ncbi:hypothetical protein ACFWCB_11405 [Streptomyces sp. NPDC060048]|uniref:hypothetical protein n=1 Tax=unclassified Streptomyces TaxID=2593676 RepID=UPI0036D1E81E
MMRKLAAAVLVAASLMSVGTSVAYAEGEVLTSCDGDVQFGEDVESTRNEFIAWGSGCYLPTGEFKDGQTSGPGHVKERVCEEWRKVHYGYAEECMGFRSIVYSYEKAVTAEDDFTGEMKTKFYGLRQVSKATAGRSCCPVARGGAAVSMHPWGLSCPLRPHARRRRTDKTLRLTDVYSAHESGLRMPHRPPRPRPAKASAADPSAWLLAGWLPLHSPVTRHRLSRLGASGARDAYMAS